MEQQSLYILLDTIIVLVTVGVELSIMCSGAVNADRDALHGVDRITLPLVIEW